MIRFTQSGVGGAETATPSAAIVAAITTTAATLDAGAGRKRATTSPGRGPPSAGVHGAAGKSGRAGGGSGALH